MIDKYALQKKYLDGKLQADTDEKALEAAVASLLGTAAGRIKLAKWDERAIKEIKQLFLVVDPSQIDAMFKVSRLSPVNKSNLLDSMIEFTGDVLATLEKINLSGMSTDLGSPRENFKESEPDDRCAGA